MSLYLLLLLAWLPADPSPVIYSASEAKISFFAGTPVEDIDATNEKAISFLNINTGEVTISIPNKDFSFKSPLMGEHFNENYMETAKFPKSLFKGKIVNVADINWKSTTPFIIKVDGELTIHGVARKRTIEVTITVQGSKILGETKFQIPLADHNIERPKILWEKLAEEVVVTASFAYERYKK